jgi:hypothetical protein
MSWSPVAEIPGIVFIITLLDHHNVYVITGITTSVIH